VSAPGIATLPDRTPSTDRFGKVESPETASGVGEALAEFAGSDVPVVPLGGGGALALGNPTSDSAIALRLDRLNRILDYQPTDMTLSVEAGARLADVQRVLGERGQMLPIEAPDPERATIGGLLASALAGPRRYGAGSLRDVIIGISVAYPDGTLGKAGGLVVKNVSGFDMMRLHYGALGSLGVITSANFKVLPVPKVEFTAQVQCADLAQTEPILEQFRRPDLRPVALVISRIPDGWQVTARFEGRESGLRAVRSELSPILDGAQQPEGQASASFWSEFMGGRAFSDPGEVRIRITAQPSKIAAAASSFLAKGAALGVVANRVEIEPGLGQITAGWRHQPEASAALITALRGDSRFRAAILTAPDDVKAGFDVWGEEPEAIELMRRLKHEFDPGRILNPGRFVGRL
jgi:glycolate oxidase FAD binding subunit